jgi:hypothetical protein
MQQASCRFELDPSPCQFMILGESFKSRGQRLSSADVWRWIECKNPFCKVRFEKLYYAQYENQLLLLCELSDGESGWGRILRLNPKSLQARWGVTIEAFNLSPGVIEGSVLYQAGIGLVAAVDLSHGRFAWKHDGLYDRERLAFNSFEPAEITETEVLFREHIDTPRPGRPGMIRVNKRSGVIHVE